MYHVYLNYIILCACVVQMFSNHPVLCVCHQASGNYKCTSCATSLRGTLAAKLFLFCFFTLNVLALPTFTNLSQYKAFFKLMFKLKFNKITSLMLPLHSFIYNSLSFTVTLRL